MKNLNKRNCHYRAGYDNLKKLNQLTGYSNQVRVGQNKKAFTLVELIIVITILAILATIAFVSFQGYSKNARDGNRLATIKNIETGLELFTIKTSNFPKPDEYITFTGGLEGKTQINQGIVGENVIRLIQMNSIPLDPKDKSKYTYSTFGDSNTYYQIGVNSENNQISFIPQAIAFTPSSAIVRGNYKFDPSLPSLIIVPSSMEGKESIFDTEVCFVIDGGKNSLDNCVEKKSEMSLKQFDSGLVGYWDMETIFSSGGNNYLKDLSGNGINAVFSGTTTELSGGIFGNGTLFHTGGYIIENSNFLNQYKDLTIKLYLNTLYEESETFNEYHTGTDSMITYQNIINRWNCTDTCSQTGAFWMGLSNHIAYNKGISLHIYDLEKKYNTFHNISGYELLGTQKWYELVLVKENYNKLRVYLNQKLILEHEFENEIFNSEVPFYLGTAGHNLGRKQSPGIIDEVKIYNRALTDEEIRQQAYIAGF